MSVFTEGTGWVKSPARQPMRAALRVSRISQRRTAGSDLPAVLSSISQFFHRFKGAAGDISGESVNTNVTDREKPGSLV